jgi:mRNA interferase MazF
MSISVGDICLVSFPFTDTKNSKLRPALIAEPLSNPFLVMSDVKESPTSLHAVFLPISSTASTGPYNIVIDGGDDGFAATGLKVTSTVLCWKISTIHKGLVKRKLGVVSDTVMSQVRGRLAALLDLKA